MASFHHHLPSIILHRSKHPIRICDLEGLNSLLVEGIESEWELLLSPPREEEWRECEDEVNGTNGDEKQGDDER